MNIKYKRGIIISLVMIIITGCIGFKVLGTEDEVVDVNFEKLDLIQAYVPEQEIVEENNRFQKRWRENTNLIEWIDQDKEMQRLGFRNPNLINYLNKNVYSGKTREERLRNKNKYYNTVNAIDYLKLELYKKENKELENELFTLVEDYIYNSRMGNIEDIILSRSDDVDKSLEDLECFLEDNKINIHDIDFDRTYYGYTVGSLPLDFKISYAITVKDGKNVLGGTMDQTVYLDLDDETLYSNWKETKKNNNYKFKVIGVENFDFKEFSPEQ